jgi:hypothetical protein
VNEWVNNECDGDDDDGDDNGGDDDGDDDDGDYNGDDGDDDGTGYSDGVNDDGDIVMIMIIIMVAFLSRSFSNSLLKKMFSLFFLGLGRFGS